MKKIIKDKIYELKITDDMEDESGIDSISLVDTPAIEINWVAFSKEKEHSFHIPDGEDAVYLEKLLPYGQNEQELLDEGYEIDSIQYQKKNEFINSYPNQPSDLDTNLFRIRYKYVKNPEAPGKAIIATTRDFCKELIQKNLVFRLEDMLNQQNDEGDSFADWRGGYNCRHLFAKIVYKKKGRIDNGDPKGGNSGYDILGDEQNDTRVPEWPSFSKQKMESISDYPESVKNNAKAVLKWVDENGWGSCGTPVGKARVNQLAKGEPISEDTIKRMYSYLSRHKVDLESSKGYGDGCGKLMYDSWGGLTALSWAESKVKSFNKDFKVGVPHYTQDGKLWTGETHKDANGRLMTGLTHSEDSEYLYHIDELDNFGYDNTLPAYVDELPKKKKDYIEEDKVKCEKCGHSWDMQDGGEKPYMCNKCGYDNSSHKQNMSKQYFQTDEEKRTIVGPAMVPDMNILRKDIFGNTYYVFFSKDTISQIAEKYMRNKYLDNNDLMHDGKAVNDVYVIESWIIEDSETDKSKKYGFSLPVGTWMIAMKCAKTPQGDEVWEQIKSKKLQGFSVSGFFVEQAAFAAEEVFLQQVAQILSNIKE